MRRSLLALLAAGMVAFLLAISSGAPDAEASNYTAVAAGALHTCAKTATGGLECWGDNTYGQLGNGSEAESSQAVGVSGLSSGVAQVELGAWHSCAVLTSGAIKCWGRNLGGSIGVGDDRLYSTTPVDVCATGSTETANCVALTGVTQVSAGLQHTCAVTTAGGVKCWGDNGNGQLGAGTQVEPSEGLASGP